tara:strand:+ start:2256 stop:3494 length:1239 start_codon:yes stop_codon:yes gene_type:complete
MSDILKNNSNEFIASNEKIFLKNKKKLNTKILAKDFTYFIKEQTSSLYAIRLTKYSNLSLIITIYYPYRSIIFGNDKQLIDWNTIYIYEEDLEHKTYFHKSKNPYDWHIHLKIKNTNLEKYLSYFVHKKYISKNDYKKLLDLVINFNVFSNIQLEGSKSQIDLLKFREERRKTVTNLNILKFDKTLDSINSINISNYIIRICSLNYVIPQNDLIKIKKLYIQIKKIYQNEEKLVPNIQFEIFNLKPKYKKNYLIFFKILKSIIFLQNKNLKHNKKLKLNFKEQEGKYKIMKKILRELINIDLEINYIFSIICYLTHLFHIENNKEKIKFEEYFKCRYNFEISWNIFQYFKYRKLKDFTNTNLHFKILNLKYKIKKNTIENYFNICNQKLLIFSPNSDLFKLSLKMNRSLPFN